MQVVIYTSGGNALHQTLAQNLNPGGDGYQVRHIADIQTLSTLLHQPLGTSTIAVLAPVVQTELAAMVNLRHLMRDRRIVLILPQDDAEMMRQSHLLRPRFVCQGKSDLSDVSAVINRMVARR